MQTAEISENVLDLGLAKALEGVTLGEGDRISRPLRYFLRGFDPRKLTQRLAASNHRRTARAKRTGTVL